MAISENVTKVFEYVVAHKDEKLSTEDVANALGLGKRTVQGAFLTLSNKGVGHTKNTKSGTKVETVKFIELTEDGKTFDGDLSENGAIVLKFLRENADTKVTAKDISEALDIDARKISGIVNGLCKGSEKTGRPSLAQRVDAKIEIPCEVKYFTVENADVDLTATTEE